MKLLYLDLGMGAAGDMLAGALLGLLPAAEREDFLRELNGALPEGVTAALEAAEQHGLTGMRFAVKVRGAEERPDHEHHEHHEHPDHEHHEHREHHGEHHHAHAGLEEIAHIIGHMGLEAGAEETVMDVYRAIAAAESEVHGVPVGEIHFHELGALDAVADITATALLLRRLAPDKIVASPVAVGSGTVRCAHGVLPVPAPATALLLRGIPALAGTETGEMCTPTGAALIGRFVTDFGAMPPMTARAVGYGFGHKQFPERPNCVRAVLGEVFNTEAPAPEEIFELSCNLDDMSPEAVGFALERLYAAGALEAFTLPAGMKKSRPGVLLTALCREETRAAVRAAMFAHTATLGVREARLARYALEREIETVQTAFGPVRRKMSRGYGAERCKWEYEDLAAIARAEGMTLDAVREVLDSDGRAE